MEAGLVCFREMQPVHLKYLVDARKIARLSTKGVHAVMNRFQNFVLQQARDDEVDEEAETHKSGTVYALSSRARKREYEG